MSQFPVEYSSKDSESLVEAINYALSGPGGLGQNFSGYSDSYTAWLRGNIRSPATVAGYTTPAHGASTVNSITVSNPGSVRQNDANVPSKISVGQYVYGTNIGTGAQVDSSYEPNLTPWDIPLTVANTGAVQGPVTFYNLPQSVLYVAALSISTIDWIDTRTIQVNFTTTQALPPFELGMLPTVAGSSAYNGIYYGPGVVACTESYVILQSNNDIANLGQGLSGTIKVSNTIQPPAVGVDPGFPSLIYFNATDCANLATVNGSQDRVFISAQVDNTISYTATAASTLEYSVGINRYVGIPALVTTNTELQYFYDATIAVQSYQYSVTNTINITNIVGSGTEVTLTFAEKVIAPYAVGSSVVLTGINPGAYNGTYTVTSCTTTELKFASTTTTAYVSGGVIAGALQSRLPVEKTVFTNVIDKPDNAFYLYRIDLLFRVINDSGAAEVTLSKLGNRSISIQVVKQ